MALTQATKVSTQMMRVGDTGVDTLYIDPRDFGAKTIDEDPTFDSAPAFQKAHDAAKAAGVGVVRFQGKYNWLSAAGGVFNLPRDDGTVAPSWVGVNGDVNIPAEQAYTMPVCVRWDADIALVGDGIETSVIYGNYAVDSDPIDINQRIGILITAGSQYTGTRRYRFEGFTMARFFIGRVGEGIMERSFESIRMQRCIFPGLFQGFERRVEDVMQYNECYTGDIFGGWWTQRNATRNSVALLPPYPAKDVFSLGWTDFMQTNVLVFEGRSVAWSSRHEAADAFFDKYFYKSGNSARYRDGGRLSNNSDASNPAIMPTYYGVVGRARTVLSRYGRGVASTNISSLKVLGSHRTPIWFDQGVQLYGCVVSAAYLERVGVVNNASQSLAESNLFGKVVKDPYRPSGYGVGFAGTNIVPLGNSVVSTGVQLAPLSSAPSLINQGGITIGKLKGDTQETQRQIYMDMTTFNRTNNNFVRDFRFHEDYFFSRRPHRFLTESGEDFQYSAGTFKPTLDVAGTTISTATAVGTWKRVGKMVFIGIAFFDSSKTSWSAGEVRIKGLPNVLGVSGGESWKVTKFLGIEAGVNLSVRMSGSDLIFYKDTSGTKLSGNECNNPSHRQTSVECSGWFMIT